MLRGTSNSAATSTFIQSGTGAVTRSEQSKLREAAISPQDFGAVGDGSTDDTAAVQLWINDVASTTTPKKGIVPPGTYKLTDKISVPAGADNFTVEYVGAPTFKQYTNNKPIFYFANDGVVYSYAIRFHGQHRFEWNTAQTTANTLSIGYAFDNTAAGGTGYYCIAIEDFQFVNGYRAIATYPGHTGFPGLWNAEIRRLQDYGGSGSSVYLVHNSGGAPCVTLDNLLLLSTRQAETSLDLQSISVLRATSINRGDAGSGAVAAQKLLMATSCREVQVQGVRLEGETWGTGLNAVGLLAFSGCTLAEVKGLDIDNVTVNAAASDVFLVRSDTSGKTVVSQVEVRDNCTLTAGTLRAVASVSGTVTHVGRPNKLKTGVPLYYGGVDGGRIIVDSPEVIPGYFDNVDTASFSNLTVLNGAAVSSSRAARRAGRVIGIAWSLSGAISSGSFTLYARKNTTDGPTTTINSGSGTSGEIYFEYEESTLQFARGDLLQMRANASSVLATGLDLQADLIVQYD